MKSLASKSLVLCGLLAVGCGADRDEEGTVGVITITASASATATEGDTDPPDDDGNDTEVLDVGVATGDEGPVVETGEECASVSETADVGLQPADIIFIVDNSGSMSMEAGFVQQNMNAFSSQIFLANIDAHVVLLSAYPTDDAGICIDLPLGIGMCPTMDSNPPGFTHLDVGIGSNNGLQRLIEQFPNFEGVLRQTASKHIVIVSDDDSDLGAAAFTMMYNALSPANVGFIFHGIVADADPITSCLGGNPCCAISAAPGDEYIQLINDTGGIFGNLCEQNFQPIFDALAEEVVAGATLSCEFAIPEPPEGETFDADKVNVEFDDGNGGTLMIGRVNSVADCAGVDDGWYYDNPAAPMSIIVCPQTCDTIQGFSGATIDIQFGCETIVAPPAG